MGFMITPMSSNNRMAAEKRRKEEQEKKEKGSRGRSQSRPAKKEEAASRKRSQSRPKQAALRAENDELRRRVAALEAAESRPSRSGNSANGVVRSVAARGARMAANHLAGRVIDVATGGLSVPLTVAAEIRAARDAL